jgi:hypothetical protein
MLDQCRIRWGQVQSVTGGQAVVRSRPLTWNGKVLGLGSPRLETATLSVDGLGFTDVLQPGEWVSLHWTWICDRLSARQLTSLRHYSAGQLEMTNRDLAHPGPAMVLG